MKREEIIAFLGKDWDRTAATMAAALKSDIELLNTTNSSLLSNSGKQLRPMLALLTARLCGSVNDDTVRLAAASELLHNATLLHDDVADESSMRRGRPTLASLMGPSAAVLVGDFWLARTVSLVMETGCHERVIPLYAKTLTDLSEGEMLQLEKAGSCDTTEEDYLRIIYCKTASLFETACRSAAVSVGAADTQVEAVVKYADALGIAFQIRDDIFDYCGGEIGKPVGIDLKEQKITMPLFGALLKSDDQQAVRELVRTIQDHPENCDTIRNLVLSTGGVEYAMSRLEDFIEQAVDALSIFPESKERTMLEELARYNAIRKA